MEHAPDAAQFLAAACPPGAAMHHCGQRRPVTGLGFRHLTIDHVDPTVIRPRSPHHLLGHCAVVGEQRADEAAAAGVGQRHGLLEIIERHDRGDRPERLDGVQFLRPWIARP